MPLIWCAVSSHGFGHAAQVIPVLNELGRIIPDLTVLLRTDVPASFFKDHLEIAWKQEAVLQDVGCIQQGPLTINVEATWAAHRRFHDEWDQRLDHESRAMHSARPALVVSDISYLALEAARRAQIPAVALCNLSWDRVLEPLIQPDRPEQQALVEAIRQAYGHADLMIHLTPGIPMSAFQHVIPVGPVLGPLRPATGELRATIGAAPGDSIVLIGFGGIALHALPFAQLERLAPYRFVMTGPVPEGCQRCHSSLSLPIQFGTLVASADVLVTKPGYSTVVEVVAHSKPVVYVRRYNFADEQSLVDYLHRYSRAMELSRHDFAEGQWRTALDAVRAMSLPTTRPPQPTGAQEAARLLAGYLR